MNNIDITIIQNAIKNIKIQKIIITSTQYPRYGGAATAAYEMHKYLIKNGIQSYCIFFDNSIINDTSKFNPDKLPNVYAARLTKNYISINTKIYENIKNIIHAAYGAEPYTIYCFNYLAPILSKSIFYKSTIYYLITGCSYISNDNLIDSTSFLKNTIKLYETDAIEKYTMQISDVIVPNSELTKNILEHIYKIYLDKYIDLHEIFKINSGTPLNENRPYDIVFVCSNYTRNVKNIDLVKKIYYDSRLSKYQKICIGKNSEKYIPSNKLLNIKCMDFVRQDELISILNHSKLVLIPSYIESYSITAVEGTQCGCIVLTIKNAACAATFNKYFVMDTYNIDDWTNKIDIILQNYDYSKKIFINKYDQTNPIENLWSSTIISSPTKINILFASVDIPYIGGAATNLYKLIKIFNKDSMFNIFGLYFSNIKGEFNPDKINNIYRINIDRKTEKNLLEFKENIHTKIGKIDIIFCKNYKVVPFMKKIFSDVKIIFSPSGLRYVSSIIDNEYVTDLNLTNISENKVVYDPKTDIYNFITENDKYLDYYALAKSDVIIPNSLLTYNIIKKLYGDRHNLYYPICITNIALTNASTPNFLLRENDILFCCLSWKRKCKNYKLVENIVNHYSLKNKKIIIIGNNQTATYDNNVSKYIYLENAKLLELLKTVKVVVIPSKYDSNPNILVEAIEAGCNVVTTLNVGNYENLNKNCIVTDYHKPTSWISTIIKCLVTKYDFIGPDCNKIFYNLRQLFISLVYKNKKAVCIYKIPPEIDQNINITTAKSSEYFEYSEILDDIQVSDLVNYDIYFNIFLEICNREACTDINYIIYDQTIDKNKFTYVHKTYPTYSNNIKIWKIKDIPSLMHFNNASVYFMRGNYHNFYKTFLPDTAKTILYPATAPVQANNNTLAIPKKNIYNFSIVLVHEDPIYKQIYSKSKCVIFNKYASDKFVFMNKSRIYDLCFVATDKQITKNHHLFLHFVKYLDNKQHNLNIIFIGDLNKIMVANKMEDFLKKLTHIKFTNKHNCSKEELIEIYNSSRINILFSGRDAYPRVITESGACGCFNIALDTLSDGKIFYDGYAGVLIGDPHVPKKLQKALSLSYDPSYILWDKIEKYINMPYDHKNISLHVKNKYNIQNVINEIYN